MWKLTERRVLKLYINDWLECKTIEWKTIRLDELDKSIEEFNEKYPSPQYELEIHQFMELDYED